MTLPAFCLAVFSLLILPGPTNALLALASHGLTGGRLVSLLGTVLAAYLIIIIPVSGIAGPCLLTHPAAAQLARIVAAIWVLSLALKLWRTDPDSNGAYVGLTHLFITTLLNPKAIIIGLTMVPAVQAPFGLTVLCFAASVSLTSAFWILLSRIVTGRGQSMRRLASRCGSAVLVAFAITLTVSAVA